MCSSPGGGVAAVDDAVRALTGTVRALSASGRGAVAAAEAEALLGLVEAAGTALLERIAVLDVEGVCSHDVTLTAAAWLRRRSKATPAVAARTVRLARRLHTDPDRRLHLTAEALAAGEVTTAQAQAIAEVTAAAPPGLVAPIEEALVGHGSHLGADEVRRVGKALVDRLTAAQSEGPDVAEQERGGCYVRLHQTAFGRVALEGILSTEVAALMRAVLDPLAAPAPSTDDHGGRIPDPRSAGERLHDALGEALAIAAGSDATTGQNGSAPHVQVLVEVDELLAAAQRAARRASGDTLDTGGQAALTVEGMPLSEAELAGLGCDARVSWLAVRPTHVSARGVEVEGIDAETLRRALATVCPALGGLPLDVLAAGRATRLVTPAQRRALDARDRGCVIPGCAAPPRRCHAHHVTHWIHGGATDLANLVLICPAHHRFLHERHWTLRPTPSGWRADPPPDLRLVA